MTDLLNPLRQDPSRLYPHEGAGWRTLDESEAMATPPALINPNGHCVNAYEGDVCRNEDGKVLRLIDGSWIESKIYLPDYPYMPFMEFHVDDETIAHPAYGICSYMGAITRRNARPQVAYTEDGIHWGWYAEDLLGHFNTTNTFGTLTTGVSFNEE